MAAPRTRFAVHSRDARIVQFPMTHIKYLFSLALGALVAGAVTNGLAGTLVLVLFRDREAVAVDDTQISGTLSAANWRSTRSFDTRLAT